MGKVRLLIVDDETSLCELIKRALERMSPQYEISTTNSGEDALKILEGEEFDVLITDIRMPGIDGMELLERASALQTELQTIVITGHGDLDYAIKALRMGAINFIKKPISFEILHFSIQKGIEKLELKRKLQENEEKFRGAFMNAPTGMLIFEPPGNFIQVNETICKMLGYTKEELMSKSLKEITYEQDEVEMDNHLQRLISGEVKQLNLERRYRRSDGKVLWGVANLSVLPNPDKSASDMIIQIVDITERKEAEESLQIEKTFLDKLFESAPEGMVLVDNNGTIKNVNNEFVSMFNYSKAEALGQNIDRLIAREDEIDEAQKISKLVGEGVREKFETVRYRKDGTPVSVSIIGAPVRYGDGQIAVYGIYRDISKRKEAEQKLEFQARNDALTGLYNRHSFFERINQELHYSQRYDVERALLFIDLDHFKEVNDKYGHDLGDRLLVEVAARLKRSLRESDIIYRLGGDEFVILINNQFDLQPKTVAKRVTKELARPYQFDDIKIKFVTASIGISLFPLDDDDASAILSRADSAMYAAKEAGRDKYLFWEPGMKK